MSVRVILADDHHMFRDGLRGLIEKQPMMQVVGEAEDGRTAVRLVQQLQPDIVVIDISMPKLNGIEATGQILADVPEIKVIALSMHSDKRFIAGMLKAGARGYLLKDSAFDELVTAINTVMRNHIYLSPQIADVVIKDYVLHLSPVENSVLSMLTPREREVLQLIAEGHPTKQVASELDVSVKTIETHRQRMMRKLNIFNLADLIKFALREGLISIED